MKRQFVRNIYYPLAQRWKGHRVPAYFRELRTNEQLSPEEWLNLQRRLLLETLQIAEKTAFYRELFQKLGFKLEVDNYNLLPITQKSQVRNRLADFLNPHFQGKVVIGRTSGSTGIELLLHYDSAWDERSQADQQRGRSWWKWNPGDRELVIWGKPFVNKWQERKTNFKLWLLNRRHLSAFELGEAELERILPNIIKFNPEVIYGYASAIGRFAEYLGDKFGGDGPIHPRAIVYTTEVLLPLHREVIKSVLGIDPSAEYGSAEAGIIAFQCPEGGLHISADRVLLEIADADAQGYGHIIITPFGNQAMALIRYDVGDLGKLVHKPCPCGRTLPRLELAQGRVTDVIKTPSGKVVTSVFFDYIGRGLRPLGLRQFRAIQKSDTHFLLQLAQNQSNSAEIELSIRNRFREYLGSEITVDFEYVEAILPEKTGKLRYFYKLGD